MPRPFALEPLRSYGAAVTGLAIDGEVEPSVARALYEAWLAYGILVFPAAGTTAEKHIALSKVFGELEIHPLPILRDKDNPQLAPFGTPETKGPPFMVDGERRAGYVYWHQDTAHTPNLCKGSMLRLIDVPERGGDTVWCDMVRAYDDLPTSMKQWIATLETLNAQRNLPPRRMWGMSNHQAAQLPDGNGKMALAEFGDSPLVRHPMVLTHPESGLKSLLLYPLGYLRVLGLDQGEGDALYDQIVGHALQDKYCYRHHWRPHDMVLWDNRRTMHMAFGYPYEMKRHGFRTTLKNDFRVGRYDET